MNKPQKTIIALTAAGLVVTSLLLMFQNSGTSPGSGAEEQSSEEHKRAKNSRPIKAAQDSIPQEPIPTYVVTALMKCYDSPTSSHPVESSVAQGKILNARIQKGKIADQWIRERLVKIDSQPRLVRVVEDWQIDPSSHQAVNLRRDMFLADQVIVNTVSGINEVDLGRQLEASGMLISGRIGDDTYTVRLKNADLDAVPEALRALQDNPDLVVSAEADGVGFGGGIPDDPLFSQQWGLHNLGGTGSVYDTDINAPEFWDICDNVSGIVIAVLDSGLSFSHRDLQGIQWINPNEIARDFLDNDSNGYRDDIHGWDFVNNDNDPTDDHDHGSHVTGIIAANRDNREGVAGVLRGVRILVCKILNENGSGLTSDLIAATAYARRLGVPVMNLSLQSYPYSSTLYAEFTACEADGIVLSICAGNQGGNNDITPNYPSSYPHSNIIAVGNHDSTDRRWAGSLNPSNYGLRSVDLFAPGRDIYAPILGNSYGRWTGTSHATPFVSAVCAAIKYANPAWKSADIKNHVLNSVTTRSSYGGISVTGGRLNAFKAYSEALNSLATRILGLSGSLGFGSVNVGSTGQKSLTIRNTGNASLTITGITYPAGFSGNWSGTISPGGTQNINITFTPTAGQTYNGTITVASNSTSGANTIACSGTGISPEIACEEPAGVNRITDSLIPFGSQARGFASTPLKTIVVKNVGNAPLIITAITLTGGNAADFSVVMPKLPLTLAPGRSTQLTAGFKPTSEGIKSALLQIDSNDFDERQFRLPLSGSGTAPTFTFAASQGISAPLPSSITSLGQVVSISGLPGGVTYDASTARLTGRPTAAGAFTARASVRGSDGRTTTALVTVVVESLPAWSLGTFTSLINPPATSDATLTGLGGYLNLTATTAGTYSGSLRLGAKTFAFRGQIEGRTAATLASNPLLSSTTIITNTGDRTQDITLNFEFRPESHATLPGLTGRLIFQGRTLPINPGWQHVWNAKTNPAFGNKDRTLNVAMDNTKGTGPQGDGFATIKLTKAGLATWAVTLSDGRKVTGSFTASPDSDVPFYAPIPYPNGGALYALLATGPSGDFYKVSDSPQLNGRWIKLPTTNPSTLDRLYRVGFDVTLAISGAEHRAPARGVLLFGNPTPLKAMSFTFNGAGITSSDQLPGNDPVNLQAELRINNVIGVPPQTGLPTTLRIAPSFNATTGLLSGSIALSDIAPLTRLATSRNLSYSGLYIPHLSSPATSRIRGFFTLPELPDILGETTSNTPIQSGGLSVFTR